MLDRQALAGNGRLFGVHVIDQVLMPDSFFTDDPRGRKTLARAGVQSAASLRPLCIVLGFILAVVLLVGVAAVIGTAMNGKG